MCACVCVCVCGGGGWGVEGSYIAVVILDIGAPEYYMLTGIRNYVDMMWGVDIVIQINLATVLT